MRVDELWATVTQTASLTCTDRRLPESLATISTSLILFAHCY